MSLLPLIYVDKPLIIYILTRHVYCPFYTRLVSETQAFKTLQEKVKNTVQFQLLDPDGFDLGILDPDGFGLGILVHEKILFNFINVHSVLINQP